MRKRDLIEYIITVVALAAMMVLSEYGVMLYIAEFQLTRPMRGATQVFGVTYVHFRALYLQAQQKHFQPKHSRFQASQTFSDNTYNVVLSLY